MQTDVELRFYRKLAIGFVAIIAGVLILFLVVIPAIGSLVNYLGKPAFLDILVAPINAKIMIDGKEYRNAIYEMEPGRYTATVSKAGFGEKTIELDLKKNETTGLYLYLDPEDGNWSYFENRKNRHSLEALATINGYDEKMNKMESGLSPLDGDNSADALLQKISIKSIMPKEVSICGTPASRMNCDALEVRYDYDEKCDYDLCLIFWGRTSELNQEIFRKMKKEILDSGYDMDGYKYIYDYDEFL